MLTIRDLDKTYANGVHAIKRLNLDIPPGMFGLLGPNGSGKSSLMRTLATLQDADSGTAELLLDGERIDVLRDKHRVRGMLGYLPQDFGLYPNSTALGLLNHFGILKGLTARGERRDAVEGLLHRVNLWDVRKQKLGTFSGGMRQRFGIAQAMLGRPRLLIVDEPTAGLDLLERNRLLNLIADVGSDVVVILSTHIVEDIAELCSRMAIINKGQLLLDTTPDQALSVLAGQVWRKQIRKEQLGEYQDHFKVLSTRLVAGQPVINVLSDQCPEPGFEPHQANLTDVYFNTLDSVPASAGA